MTVSEFLVSLARIYEAGAVPIDAARVARECRDYATIAIFFEAERTKVSITK